MCRFCCPGGTFMDCTGRNGKNLSQLDDLAFKIVKKPAEKGTMRLSGGLIAWTF